MSAGDDAGTRLLISGALRFTARDAWFDAERRLAASAASGVDAEVVSPFPPLLNYRLAPVPGLDLARWVNEYIAGLAAAAPGRIYGLGMVPLQDPDLAAGELAAVAAGGPGRGGDRLQRRRYVAGGRPVPGVLRRGRTAVGARLRACDARRFRPAAWSGDRDVRRRRGRQPGRRGHHHGRGRGEVPGAAAGVQPRRGRVPADADQGPVVLGADLERGTAR